MAAELKALDGGKLPTGRKTTRSASTTKVSTPPARKPRPKTLAQAIADNDKPAEIRALRAMLARRMSDPKTSAVAVAAITKQFRELGDDLAALEGGGGEKPPADGSPASEPIPDAPWNGDDV